MKWLPGQNGGSPVSSDDHQRVRVARCVQEGSSPGLMTILKLYFCVYSEEGRKARGC